MTLPISCSIDIIVKPNTSIQVEVLGLLILEGFNQMEQPKDGHVSVMPKVVVESRAKDR